MFFSELGMNISRRGRRFLTSRSQKRGQSDPVLGLMTNGTIEDSKQALVKDLKSVIGDAGDLINNVAASGADGLARARTKLEAGLGQAKGRLTDASLAYWGLPLRPESSSAPHSQPPLIGRSGPQRRAPLAEGVEYELGYR